MELRHLRYAVAIAEELNFGRAAERLHISQPPLSMQIRSLEEELGIKLFHRTKRQVQLTEAGRLFISEARFILAHAEHAAKLAERVLQGEMGRLTVAYVTPPETRYNIEVMRRFLKRYPKIHVVVRCMTTVDQVKALHDGRIDIGLVEPIDDPALVTEPIFRQELMIAMPQKHKLAARQRVPLGALVDEPHILVARDAAPDLHDTVIAASKNAGFNLKVVHEADSLRTAAFLVAAGAGLTFLPEVFHQRHRKDIVLRPLQPALPNAAVVFMSAYLRQTTSELIPLFLNSLRSVFKNGANVVGSKFCEEPRRA
jgi:DNA-binding transcriptional LysR family regulator